MPKTIKFPGFNPEHIGALLGIARDAGSLSQIQAGKVAGVSGGTIANWEKAAGEGDALRPIYYMRELARRSTRGRMIVLDILGLVEADLTLDPKQEKRLDLYRAAFESNDPYVREHIKLVEMALRERLPGEDLAATP
jgi:transcriptional regulator with XRE-family HTH domain